MKPISDLTAADLASVPVWRFTTAPPASGDPPESIVVWNGKPATEWVTPTDLTALSEDAEDVFIAATEFCLATGARFPGFCSPTDDSGIDYVQPVIVTPTGPVRLWFDSPVSADHLRSVLTRLGCPTDEAFPLRFRCLVPCDGRYVEGVVDRPPSPHIAT